jgi:hypothetical protein
MYQAEQKKPWQHGYDMEYLVSLQEQYENYNTYADGPFAEVKKNVIAALLHKKNFEISRNACLEITKSKVKTPITMHGETIIGRKEPGDITFAKISGHNKDTRNAVNQDSYRKKYCWMYVWAEWDDARRFAEECGFQYVGCKVTTFAEIYAVYFRNARRKPERTHPQVAGTEKIAIAKCRQPELDLEKICQELKQAQFHYTNHYSNYNKKGSWGAMALRGYKDDPNFIAKPIEMNKKWKAANPGWEDWEIQDTDIASHFPYTMQLIESLPTDNIIHRARFMRLAPGGTLGRHTDQVDPDLGTRDGSIMRLHIPIYTNPDVTFSAWDMDGIEHQHHMEAGQLWYLDIRKPHEATNAGKAERIHLVIDVEACDRVRGLTEI